MNAINNNFQVQVASAAKWSAITQAAAKIVTPVTSMVLARILAPEAFGVVATVTMIVSFAEMFTDAGFQKYLVQHEFKDEDEKYKNTNVAFWTNLGIAFFLWAIIAIFCEPLATLVGNKGLGEVITIACIQLPLTSFSSIQMALYRREFDFKTLFLVRVTTILIPFFVTIPLALYGFSYWALIIGLICGQFSNATILTIKSRWKPKWFYNVGILKEMLSFSIWSLIEAISIWFTVWIDAFIIGSALNEYYLGLYKTSTSMVNSLMALITASTLPVLFSALSRLQNDSKQFNLMYFKIQRLISIFVFPLGIGVYLYSDLATQILLGNQWSEASDVIGIWALTSAITIIFGYLCSEVYRAKGKPKLSFLAQVLHLVVLVPVCIISSKYGFWTLVYARSWIRMQSVLVDFILMKFAMGFPIFKTLGNVFPTAISATAMGIIGFHLRQLKEGMIWSFVSLIICMAIYFGLLYLFPKMRKEMTGILKG
ncbi:Polysaccharide transporter, PST family [Candidatus Methylobacter favarea]|uniref:Polysaccharide transporter, PST family n=1 Tax=Candidatus Methylobacter favarea TaxID=2707345 RepID=A0A8S0WQ90_9GAMM|nr:lipopolysaccharide biosynthesis protein [Candidatus Methylobacter favarea]CAA9891295.1 Polysaccharide transporter, PST family [Candidatus Methylobacter favarea]